jgi:hypothetical protein
MAWMPSGGGIHTINFRAFLNNGASTTTRSGRIIWALLTKREEYRQPIA